MNVSANETARCGASAPVPEKKPSVGFKIVDCILIAGILLPLLGGIVIRVLTHPVESGISITGAVILAEFDFSAAKTSADRGAGQLVARYGVNIGALPVPCARAEFRHQVPPPPHCRVDS